MASRDGEHRPDGHRRKWDRNEYAKKAKARAREERGLDAEDEDDRPSSSKKVIKEQLQSAKCQQSFQQNANYRTFFVV